MQPEQVLSFFAKYIESELGIVYAEHNYFQLRNRLEEIARLMGDPGLADLHRRAEKGIAGDFKHLLIDIATNNETSFFRDMKVFHALESELLRGAKQLRIWSAASSTGQEALSIAMLISEYNEKMKTSICYSILATDISERVLSRAKAAVYSELEMRRGLSAANMNKYFVKAEDDRWRARPEITRHIVYRKLNLKEPFPFDEKFDLILCRNVLIYQTVEGKKEVLGRLAEKLSPGGLLVLGSGESLLGISEDYEQLLVEGAILYRKNKNIEKAAA